MLDQTLIPLGVYQIYLWAEESRSALAKHASAGLVSLHDVGHTRRNPRGRDGDGAAPDTGLTL